MNWNHLPIVLSVIAALAMAGLLIIILSGRKDMPNLNDDERNQ